MNTKYLAIIAGIVLLGAAGFVLVKSQYKQQNNALQGTGENPSGGSIQPTAGSESTTTGAQPNAANQIFLTINQPANGTVVSTAQLLVSGKTVPNAEVSINDQDTTSDANGSFSVPITLDEGENSIVVVGSDSNGNSSEQELTVTYNMPEGV